MAFNWGTLIHLHPEVVNEIQVTSKMYSKLANEESDKFLMTKVARFINFHHVKIPLPRNFGKWPFLCEANEKLVKCLMEIKRPITTNLSPRRGLE